VIITGFQGASSEDQITTLGRGGSDTSAIALGTALQAENCEIITDVAGIFTTNPNEQSCAQLIEKIDFDVAMEMSSSGANVIDSRAVELAKDNEYSFTIIHYSSNGGGTTVSATKESHVCGVIDNEKCVLVHASNLENQPGVFSKIIEITSG
jgi:aspartate kinase